MSEAKFKVTLTYDVKLSSDDVAVTEYSNLHVLEAVYNAQVGDLRGTTDANPPLQYWAEEAEVTIEKVG